MIIIQSLFPESLMVILQVFMELYHIWRFDWTDCGIGRNTVTMVTNEQIEVLNI